jgi:hypothetical protein
VALLLSLAGAAHGQAGSGAWDALNEIHQRVAHAFACDPEMFPTMSGGVVKDSLATPGALAAHLRRHGIEITEQQAEILLREIELTIKGRNPRKIKPSDLVTARRPGSTGLHGELAEIDFIRQNPGYANFSTGGSTTTDATLRTAGKVTSYCQVKCRSRAIDSVKGVVENWLKFHAVDRGGGRDFLGVIPKDQFAQLVAEGKLSTDGSVKDAALLQSLEQSIAKNLPDYGAKNRELLQRGLAADKVHSLKFQPLPSTYQEYVENAKQHQAASNGPDSPLKAPRAAHASAKAVGVGAAAALALTSMSGVRDARGATLAAGESALGFLEQFSDFSGSQKYEVQRALRGLPRWLRPSMPKVGTLRSIGRWGARLGAVVAVGFFAVDAYGYMTGRLSTRQFSTSSAQLGSGIAGGWAGGKVGLYVGATIGSAVPGLGTAVCGAIGATVGAVIGSLAGSWIAGAASDSLWNALEASERDAWIEGILERHRAQERSLSR